MTNMMYEFIEKFNGNFHSLRFIKEKISLDLKIPRKWFIKHKSLDNGDLEFKLQDNNEEYQLISIFIDYNQENCDFLINYVFDVFKLNKEEEEKKRLYQEKLDELNKLFSDKSFEDLKEIKLELKDGQKID